MQQAMMASLASRLDEEIREQSTALQAAEREFSQLTDSVKAVKEEARRLLATAKQAIGNDELTPELKKSFEALPSTLQEIDAAILDPPLVGGHLPPPTCL